MEKGNGRKRTGASVGCEASGILVSGPGASFAQECPQLEANSSVTRTKSKDLCYDRKRASLLDLDSAQYMYFGYLFSNGKRVLYPLATLIASLANESSDRVIDQRPILVTA